MELLKQWSGELSPGYPTRQGTGVAGWVGRGMRPLRAIFAHTLAPSDILKHETLLSSFSPW